MEKVYRIHVRFQGTRPIMFDRYAGDNNTALQVADKFYLEGGIICIPAINVMSMLTAENTKSVTKVFYPPKSGVKMRHAINSYLAIDEEYIELRGEDDRPIEFSGTWTDKVFVHKSVARLKGGVPNFKERPCVRCPWSMKFSVIWAENKEISLDALEQIFSKCGLIGLGTFRPQFGQFDLTQFDEQPI